MTRELSNIFGVVSFLKKFSSVLLCSIYTISAGGQISVPTGLKASGYDSHVEIIWNGNPEPSLSSYRLFRKDTQGNDSLIANISRLNKSYIDFTGRKNKSYTYTLTATNNSGIESQKTSPVTTSTYEMNDDELLTMVQKYTFRYFWDFGHPFSGLARERNTDNIVTIGGSGFGIMTIPVGIERNFISREQGLNKCLQITDFLLNKADRFHGVFPHWLNGTTGKTIPFSTKDNGADLVETAFMIQGLLTVREYFDGNDSKEINLRDNITKIWEEVEWSWFRRGSQNILFWHWSPDFGWDMNHRITGFNEAHIVYLLAAMSPTYSIPATVYHQGWVAPGYVNGSAYYGYPLPVGGFRGGPLFFSHYSYLGFDPRNYKDKYTNYFIRNTQHSLINWAYCVDNPKNYKGYSTESWGLTASDNPFGYSAHEPSPARDNGTITPTAALSSIPYTPSQSMAALKHFYRSLGDRLWGIYGFYDAFNLQQNWFASSYLAIDQGPIVLMIENFRTQLLWNLFMKNPEVQIMLDKLGFVQDPTIINSTNDGELMKFKVEIYPNPSGKSQRINMVFPESVERGKKITVEVFDVNGKNIQIVNLSESIGNSLMHYEMDTSGWGNGIFILKINSEENVIIKKVIINY
ncbi:MAG: T9SS type A sorting domain-containing protein [Saprospiraceae bacterium]|nr:T9SS type A sorting domain-containing protein [Saprospiraceae bacterium]